MSSIVSTSSALLEASAIYGTALARLLEKERSAKSVCDGLEQMELPADMEDAIVLRNRITFAVENYAMQRRKTTTFILAQAKATGQQGGAA